MLEAQGLALLVFAVSSTGTPGPNNMMILTSGLNFGVRRSIPHLLGICTGVPVMIILLGLGLDQVFRHWPVLFTLIKWLGGSYLLWLAWKIARSTATMEGTANAKPLNFLQAAAFQWVNPKAWVMCIGAITAFTIQELALLPQVLTIASTFMAVGLICVGTWLVAGSQLQRLISNANHQRLFNSSMAALLAISVIPMMVN